MIDYTQLYTALRKKITLFLTFLFFTSILSGQVDMNLVSRFLQKKGHPVDINNNTDFKDLGFLKKVLKDKRLVLIGELNHGSKEINLLKNRLIKYVHEELGYQVLLFESGIGELYTTHYARPEQTPKEMLYNGLFGPWLSQEYLSLMGFLREQKSLGLGGFDVQRSGRSFAKILEKTLNIMDQPGYQDMEERYSVLTDQMRDRKKEADETMIKDQKQLVNDYRQLIDHITFYKTQLLDAGFNPTQLAIITRTFENRIAYLDYYLTWKIDGDWNKRWAARDSMMAANVSWFAREIYPDEKIIITAHNFHVSKYNEKEAVMGEWLSEEFGDNLYSIGFFAQQGSYANNSRKEQAMDTPTEPNDIQTLISSIPKEATFLDIPEKEIKGSEWLFETVIANRTFINLNSDNTLVPAKWFDGLLLIKEISPAEY